MPHAALWVVQLKSIATNNIGRWGFNAARGFVGGATKRCSGEGCERSRFNAARGFVGGATASLSALVPLRGKRPFGKSPEI